MFDVPSSSTIGVLEVRCQAPSRLRLPAIELAIEESWDRRTLEPGGNKFFDGGLWRYVSHRITGGKAELMLEPTSFKIYLGTNIERPQLFKQYGDAVLANPLIVTAFVRTSDNFLFFARRSHHVAIFRGKIHTLGGTVSRHCTTLTEDDIFRAIYDELHEEAAIQRTEVNKLTCLELVAPPPHRMRQLVFWAETLACSSDLMQRTAVDRYEHDELIFVPADFNELSFFLRTRYDDIASPLQWCLQRYLLSS